MSENNNMNYAARFNHLPPLPLRPLLLLPIPLPQHRPPTPLHHHPSRPPRAPHPRRPLPPHPSSPVPPPPRAAPLGRQQNPQDRGTGVQARPQLRGIRLHILTARLLCASRCRAKPSGIGERCRGSEEGSLLLVGQQVLSHVRVSVVHECSFNC